MENFDQLTYCSWGDRIIHLSLGQLEKTNFFFFLEGITNMYYVQSTLWIQSS